MATPQGTGEGPQAGGLGCLARLFWFFGGNAILLASAWSIAQRSDLVSAWDAVFWAAVVAMAAVRYVDIARLQGTTAFGQPATMGHWRKYVLLLAAGALVLWVAVHAWSRFAGG